MIKRIKTLLTVGFVIFDVILIFGGTSKTGKTYLWIGEPLTHMMTSIAHAIGGPNQLGWAIIAVTATMRLVLLPFFLDQQRAATINQAKMSVLQPELTKLQDYAKNAKDPLVRQQASQKVMSLYSANNVSMLAGMSFLTMAAQLPLFSGLYSAILHSSDLQGATFLGLTLESRQWPFIITAGVIYFVQAMLMAKHAPTNQQSAKTTMFLSPVMIVAFSFFMSGAIGLYFIVGGIFGLIQSIIGSLQRPALEQQAKADFQVTVTADDILAGMAPAPQPETKKDVTPRNLGKQPRR